jgi:hypothetical protein
MHPLRVAFAKYVKKQYGAWPGDDKNAGRTEVQAQKVAGLGLTYAVYVEAACSLLHRWAEHKGWKYPYWNVVISDSTIGRIKVMLEYVDDMHNDADYHAAFTDELSFALDYIWWLNGQGDIRPRRVRKRPLRSVTVDVAEYLCTMYGIPCVSSNYNVIAKELADFG